MGGVFGEDATEVAPPATTCTEDCEAGNQVQGQAVVLGFPFPAPSANRFTPRSKEGQSLFRFDHGAEPKVRVSARPVVKEGQSLFN